MSIDAVVLPVARHKGPRRGEINPFLALRLSTRKGLVVRASEEIARQAIGVSARKMKSKAVRLAQRALAALRTIFVGSL